MLVPWRGRMEDALAAWRAGPEAALALSPDEVVPDFVLEAQAAALGRAHVQGRPDAAAPASGALRAALAAGFRGFVVEAPDAALLGRFLDEELVAQGAPLRTLVVDGPGFARRVDVVAGEARPRGSAWRLEVGLRGC